LQEALTQATNLVTHCAAANQLGAQPGFLQCLLQLEGLSFKQIP
jgi:hypothetical protein